MARIIALPYGFLSSVSYLVATSEKTILIDPTAPLRYWPGDVADLSLILATHGHFDHIMRADKWRQAHQAPLAIHEADADCLADGKKNLSTMLVRPLRQRPAEQLLADGDLLDVSSQVQLGVLHTPGHSAGSCCFLLLEDGQPKALFSGDTIFAGSIGRTDLGGDETVLAASLRRLADLADSLGLTSQRDLPLYPGHGPASSLRHELETNPFVRALI